MASTRPAKAPDFLVADLPELQILEHVSSGAHRDPEVLMLIPAFIPLLQRLGFAVGVTAAEQDGSALAPQMGLHSSHHGGVAGIGQVGAQHPHRRQRRGGSRDRCGGTVAQTAGQGAGGILLLVDDRQDPLTGGGADVGIVVEYTGHGGDGYAAFFGDVVDIHTAFSFL